MQYSIGIGIIIFKQYPTLQKRDMYLFSECKCISKFTKLFICNFVLPCYNSIMHLYKNLYEGWTIIMRNEEQQAHLASTQRAGDRGWCAQKAYILGKDTQIRAIALLLPGVSQTTATLAELIVECHSTPKPMCQVTVAVKCSMHKKKVFFSLCYFIFPW